MQVDITEKSGIIKISAEETAVEYTHNYCYYNAEQCESLKIKGDVVTEIIQLGKVNIQPFIKEFGELKTDVIIVTNERIEHIKSHHPQDFDLFMKYGHAAVQDPDIIIKDSKNKGTVFMVKRSIEIKCCC